MKAGLLLFLVGCTGHAEFHSESVSFALDLSGLQVMDPKLSEGLTWPMSLQLTESPESLACWAEAWIETELGQHFEALPPAMIHADSPLSWDWPGQDDEGRAFDPGEARVVASVRCGRDEG